MNGSSVTGLYQKRTKKHNKPLDRGKQQEEELHKNRNGKMKQHPVIGSAKKREGGVTGNRYSPTGGSSAGKSSADIPCGEVSTISVISLSFSCVCTYQVKGDRKQQHPAPNSDLLPKTLLGNGCPCHPALPWELSTSVCGAQRDNSLLLQ